jgi:hypothetical protein
MRLIRLAILLGVFAAIPICAVIYLGVDQLERNVTRQGAMRDALQEMGDYYRLPGIEEEGMDEGLVSGGGGFANLPAPASVQYPFSRTLENQSQGILEVVITGRAGDRVQFLSLRDNLHYQYPIGGLADQDRGFCETLPEAPHQPDQYPVVRLLTDDRGRSLIGIIEGRSQFDITFRELKSGARHTCFIGRLSLPDRAFVFGLPVNVASPPAQQSVLKPASIRKT